MREGEGGGGGGRKLEGEGESKFERAIVRARDKCERANEIKGTRLFG